MFKLQSDISIITQSGKTIRFKAIAGVKVTTSIHTLTDTCVLTLPRKFSWRKSNITDYLKRGDTIEVTIGYGDNLQNVFKGYLKDIQNGRPIVLFCEDEAWSLKKLPVPVCYYESITLQQFCDDFMTDIECKVDDVNFGETRITEETNAAKVLEYFMKHFPVRFFFRDGVFYGSLPQVQLFKAGEANEHKFKVGKNIIKDNLKYIAAEDVKIQVVAKVVTKENKKLEVKLPAANSGEGIRTFLVPTAKTEQDLKEFAENMLANFKVDKMDGTFTAFGEPWVQKGDFITLYDDDYEERNARKFIVEAVTYDFGKGGYRQIITLGQEIK